MNNYHKYLIINSINLQIVFVIPEVMVLNHQWNRYYHLDQVFPLVHRRLLINQYFSHYYFIFHSINQSIYHYKIILFFSV